MPRARSRIASLLIATATLGSLLTAIGVNNARADAPACAADGCWTAPFSPFGKYDAAPPQTIEESQEFPTAASAVVLPNGRIVYWNGLQGLEDCGPLAIPADGGACAENADSQVLDLTGSTPEFFTDIPTTQDGHNDLFCSDQRLLQNGKVFDTGGTYWVTEEPQGGTGIDGIDGLTELYGSRNTRIFDPATQTWSTSVHEMHDGRWYPTLLTLPSGDQFVASGVTKLLWNSNIMTQVEDAIGNTQYEQATAPLPENVHTTETWPLDNQNQGWTLNPARDNQELPLFPRLHLLPDGKIFYSSAGQTWGPAGESINEHNSLNMKVFDPTNTDEAEGSSWSDVGMLKYGNMSGAMSVLMPIDPAHPNSVKVLVAGGTIGPAPSAYLATPFSQMVTLNESGGSWTPTVEDTGDLNNRRWFSSSVLLPNGQVVAVSGADKDEVVLPGPEMAVRQAELFDPDTNSWTALSSDARDRTYHNSAILLPDGSVLVGGHAPANQLYGGQGNALPLDQLGFTHNLKDPSFERLYPPYLFDGPRPVINSSQAHTTWGQSLQVQIDPNSPAPIDHFVLSRLPSQTHITDADARTILLGEGDRNGSSVSLQIPSNRALVTPGFYYLFGISDEGVPSEATIVQVADPGYYIGASSATPVHLADQPFRDSAASVKAVQHSAPVNKAAKRSAHATNTPAAVTEEPVATDAPSAPARSSQAAIILLAAVMGAVLVRRIRTLARSDT